MVKKLLIYRLRGLLFLVLVLILMGIHQADAQGTKRKRHIVIEPRSAQVQVDRRSTASSHDRPPGGPLQRRCPAS